MALSGMEESNHLGWTEDGTYRQNFESIVFVPGDGNKREPEMD